MGCGVAGIAVIMTDIPLVATYMLIILLCSGLAVTVVNAAIIELYPTNMRAMAICVLLMMGRTGAIFGTNAVAYMLDDHCEYVFGLSGGTLIASAILCCFIPNIRKGGDSPKEVNLAPRMSVTSRVG